MGRVLVFLVFIFGLIGCSQNPQFKADIIAEKSNNITAKNIAEKIFEKVKHYPQETYYYLFVNHQACYFEIMVNDVPAFKYFKEGQIITPISINEFINKSGKQTITYKLYPLTKRASGDGFNTLLDWTSIKIELFQRNKADTTGNAFASEKKVLEHSSLTKPDGKAFIAEGKDYYEYTFTFDAQVPYKNKGWENSEDLSKLDQKKLLAKTENAYKQVWNILEKKEADSYFNLIFNSYLETCQAEYTDKEKIEKIIKSNLLPFENKTYKLEPLEGYKMVLYGNGRIVSLDLVSMDPRLRNKWAIWGKYTDEDDDISSRNIRFYLHIPKGKTNFEVIR